ncbi:MAG: 4-hydroxybutyryl-CoA dehydratase [Firmicutes bacterium]|nr:4-hydroxybutyryl-CoA dehydratase [Bacillota bacterium]
MALMAKQQYLDSLKQTGVKVYLFGDLLDNPHEHPMIRASVNCIGMTYELAEIPEFQEHMTATSHLTGNKINRFTHIFQGTDDLIAKVKMQRVLGQRTASCFQRCVGMDAINAVYSTTFEVDQDYGTNYHENFKKFVEMVQDKDLVVVGAMTDPKGNRKLRPSKQADPDLYLHVVERRPDGVIVRGAKAHQTGAVNSHEILVMPTISMNPEDKDYAISFAVPVGAEGIFMIYGRQSSDTRKMEESADLDIGNYTFSGQEALIIFDNVFVPNERIFLNGETEHSENLVERFAAYHRQSYGGCKVGVADVLIGAAALAAEFNGVEKANHIKDKLIEMTHLNETLYSGSIACSALGYRMPAGNYLVDLMLANVTKQNVTRFPYEITRLAEDIGGGLLATMPSEKDYKDSKIGPYCEKYLKGVEDIPTEYRLRALRLIENIALGPGASVYRVESLHGAGSPQAQRIMIARLANFDVKKKFARLIAGIDKTKTENN